MLYWNELEIPDVGAQLLVNISIQQRCNKTNLSWFITYQDESKALEGETAVLCLQKSEKHDFVARRD